MAKLTRLATTITARYYPSSDISDAFYMDGRLAGKRETRSADITTDKEDRGFLHAVFSHEPIQGFEPGSAPPYEPALRKLYTELKSGRRLLDDQIGDLVNAAVTVTGKLKIQTDNKRAPYFAGVMVKDSEAFAITMGKGLAFLYRDDTLFPMTASDISIEPINTQRQKVEHFNNYCATKTATALCSNIAQLKIDDCLIVCNREVYDALGQHELLRILYDADDQCDAAGNVITEAAAKVPNVPLQFMISFVEDVSAPEKAGFFGFGRKKNRKVEENIVMDDDLNESIEPVDADGLDGAVVAPVVDSAAEPLFFGNEPSDPTAKPRAEEPIEHAGAEEPILFEDTPMEPFGDPVEEKDSELDEGGFIKTDDSSDSIKSDNTDLSFLDEDASQEGVDESVETQDDATKSSADFNTEETNAVQADKTEDLTETLASEVKRAVEETENHMSNFDGKDTPQFIPDDDNGDEAPLFFGDEPDSSEQPESSEDHAYSDFENQILEEPEEQLQRDGGYYIPFESSDMPDTVESSGEDIPEMPTYSAPTYEPPVAPSQTPDPFEDTGVFARGSYTMEESMANSAPNYMDDSQPDTQNMYSYSAPPPPPPRPNGPPPQRRQPPGSPTGQRSGSGRPRGRGGFDEDGDFDYGRTDSTYKRNNILMLGLGVICLVLVIVIIVFVVSRCGRDDVDMTESFTQPTMSTDTTVTDDPSIVAPTDPTDPMDPTDSIDPTEPTEPVEQTDPVHSADEPIGVFVFSENTGYRTWWDLFNRVYNIQINNDGDRVVGVLKEYNNLPDNYVPQPGDQINLPPSTMLQ